MCFWGPKCLFVLQSSPFGFSSAFHIRLRLDSSLALLRPSSLVWSQWAKGWTTQWLCLLSLPPESQLGAHHLHPHPRHGKPPSLWIQNKQVRGHIFPRVFPLFLTQWSSRQWEPCTRKKLEEKTSFLLRATRIHLGHISCPFLEGSQRPGKQSLSTWGFCSPLKSLSPNSSVSPGHGEQAAHWGQEHHGSHQRAAKDVGAEEAGDR